MWLISGCEMPRMRKFGAMFGKQPILASKDEDFIDKILNRPKAKPIWSRAGNCRTAFLLELIPADMRGSVNRTRSMRV
jgi:predicted nuclease of predicted toxin-antitoxin system